MSSWNVNTSHPLQTRDQFVADQLRNAILRGHFKPGQKLDQNEIADLLKVSRSPVREALRTLAGEELIQMYPHRGAIVTELSVNELEEIYFLRGNLEGLAARLAATKIDETRIARLQTLLDQLNQPTDLDHWIDVNGEFHSIIYQTINRPRLYALIQNLRNISAPYTRQYIASPTYLEKTKLGHQAILNALIEKDGARAEDETKKHLQVICDGVLVSAESLLTKSVID